MEISIADRWNWITIDSGGAKWVWEGKPYYDEGSCTWEEDVAGDSRCIWLVELNFGEDIKDDKDKIWKRNGDDWEYAGGQMTKERAEGEFPANIRVLIDYLKLTMVEWSWSLGKTGYWSELNMAGQTQSAKVGDTMMAFSRLAQLIKDAEGGKDEG